MLEPFYNITGEAPILCFSTCKGMQPVRELAALSYQFVIGNTKVMHMNVAMAAFITFYHGLYSGLTDVRELVEMMCVASNNRDFYFQAGRGH